LAWVDRWALQDSRAARPIRSEPTSYTRLHRAFIRQTIDLDGDVQKVDAGPNQFAGSQTSDRLVLTVGKFGPVDVFATNKYAHDPRGDFLNWTILDTGTFDYAADAWAYAVGATAEWYVGNWTFRGGLFDLSIAPNQTALDPTFGQFQWIGEIERRYSIWGQPGKVAITGFLMRGRMGSFEDAIELAAVTGGPADITAVRQCQSRGGISMNLEQQLMPNVGFFARAGIADGNKEPYEFTDVDRTVAAGFSVSGKQWGDGMTTHSALPASSTASPGYTRHFSTRADWEFWLATVSCLIPAPKKSSRPITAFQYWLRRSRSTTSSS
jgi:high affinity Mn2+ porin